MHPRGQGRSTSTPRPSYICNVYNLQNKEASVNFPVCTREIKQTVWLSEAYEASVIEVLCI
jgi:hypothetical protein